MSSAAGTFPEQALCARCHWDVSTLEPAFRPMVCTHGCVRACPGAQADLAPEDLGLSLGLSACVFLKRGPSLAGDEEEAAGEAVTVIRVGGGF